MPVRSVVLTVVVALIVAAVIGLWVIDSQTPDDAPVPAALARLLDPAREAARSKAGLGGLVPFRFVSARCSADGTYAALAFDAVIGPGRAYALIGFPLPSQAPGPISAISIIGETSEAFAADTALQGELSSSCEDIPSP
ncbi:MAG TPA: hypothetical protein VMH24_01740 [Candidatus Sulfotelmatobacter sp.]|nr:hypothetical protein [Candidatus Sulfotelmatobacter sp.]